MPITSAFHRLRREQFDAFGGGFSCLLVEAFDHLVSLRAAGGFESALDDIPVTRDRLEIHKDIRLLLHDAGALTAGKPDRFERVGVHGGGDLDLLVVIEHDLVVSLDERLLLGKRNVAEVLLHRGFDLIHHRFGRREQAGLFADQPGGGTSLLDTRLKIGQVGERDVSPAALVQGADDPAHGPG